MNVFADEWDDPFPPTPGWEQHVKRLVPRGHDLGMSLYELPSGQTQVAYHFHHGNEEALLVLRGRPTVRTPNGSSYVSRRCPSCHNSTTQLYR